VFRDGGASGHVLYRTLLTEGYREYCRAHATGTTNLGLGREDFLAYPLVLPDGPLLTYFNGVMDAMDRRMNTAVVEAMTLAELRDTLLPRLLTGELRVRDADQIVERAV
jgi:type I restriction enzyme S subunit